MFPAMWRIDPCMNIDVKTVSQVGMPPLRAHRIWLPAITSWLVRQCVSTVGIAPYLTDSYAVGPPISDPPWRIASRYEITLARISATVTNGKRFVGMLSFRGITRLGSLCPLAELYAS